MELKINLDTKAVATQMVGMMLANLHGSITSFTQQRLGSIHPNTGYQAGPFAGSAAAQAGFPFGWPTLQQYMPFPGQYPPPGHPYAPYGAPPPPYVGPGHAQAHAQSQQHPQQPQPPKSQYQVLMDEMSKDQNLINAVENILSVHLQEYLAGPSKAG